MNDARAEVLGRIRSALGAGPAVPEVPRGYHGPGAVAVDLELFCERVADYRAEVPRGYHGPGAVAVDLELFCERVADYRAEVHRVSHGELAGALAEACSRLGLARVATTLDHAVEGVELVRDDPLLAVTELDGLDGVLTGCALGIAETGSFVLDGGATSGRRALTLVPDVHLCVIDEAQVVASVPDAVAALAEAAAEGRPVTFVSGPSATSDIELDRVEGVHGPRTLEVFVVAR